MKPQASLQVTIFHDAIIGLHDFLCNLLSAKYKIRFYFVTVVYFAKTLKILPPVNFTGLVVYFLLFLK